MNNEKNLSDSLTMKKIVLAEARTQSLSDFVNRLSELSNGGSKGQTLLAVWNNLLFRIPPKATPREIRALMNHCGESGEIFRVDL